MKRFLIVLMLVLSACGADSESLVVPTLIEFPTETATLPMTDTPAPTETSIPSDTPTLTVTSSNTPSPTDTDVPTNTPAPTNTDIPTATVTNTPAPTSTLSPSATSNTGGLDATRLEVAINSYTDVEVLSIDIIDNRNTGGERGAIIAYVNSGPSSDAAVLDLLGVLIAIADSIEQFDVDLDTVVLFYGASETSSSSFIGFYADDIEAWANDEITIDQLVDRSF